MMIDLECEVVASGDQVSCEMDGEMVILNTRSGEYFGLNQVGATIWELLQPGRRLREIRDELLTAFPDADPETCSNDLLQLVSELVDVGLVEVAKTSEASQAGASTE